MTYPLPGLPARHEQFEILTARVSRAPGGGDALGRMIHVQWDRGSKRKLLEVSCVVPKSQTATEALKRLFAADLARAVGGLRGPESLNATRTEPGSIVRGLARLHSPGAQFTGDIIWCSYWEQGDQLICDGVPCTNEAELRWHDVDRIAADIWYECTNGCYVERGTGFWCPWGSGGGVGEGEDPGEGSGGGGGEPGDHQLPDGGPAGFLEGCEDEEPGCDLAPLDSTMIELIGWAARQLPPWASGLLLAALADDRIQFWTNDIYRTTAGGLSTLMRADVHFNFEQDPNGKLHLHLSAFSNLRHILCHEMAHWYYGIRGHPSELFAHAAACESYEPT